MRESLPRHLSRREFLKITAASAIGTGLALAFPERAEAGVEREPLTGLPVLLTHDTPVLIQFFVTPEKRHPWRQDTWLTVSDVPVEFTNPQRVEAADLPDGIRRQGKAAIVASLPHFTGSHAEMTAIVGWVKERKLPSWPAEEGTDVIVQTGRILSQERPVATYSYSDQENIYPIKIFNVLTALAAIARYNRTEGPLLPGQEYSYFQMTDLRRRTADYKGWLAGVGICATASTLAKTQFLTAALGQTTELERHLHSPQWLYWVNNLDPAYTQQNSDATVRFYVPPSPQDFNYAFRVNETAQPFYIAINAQTRFADKPVEGDYTIGADARMWFSYTFQKTKPPDDQEQRLLELRDSYWAFHRNR